MARFVQFQDFGLEKQTNVVLDWITSETHNIGALITFG